MDKQIRKSSTAIANPVTTEHPLRVVLAGWVNQLRAGDSTCAADALYNGNKWVESRWQNLVNAIIESIRDESLRIADEQIVGPIGQVCVLLGAGEKPRPERICFMKVAEEWRILASIGDFTACPWDYNTERGHAMTDLNCDYMRWAARKSGWTAGQLLGLEALLRLAKKDR